MTESRTLLAEEPLTNTSNGVPESHSDKDSAKLPLLGITKTLNCRTIIHKRFATDVYPVCTADATAPSTLIDAFHKHISPEAIDDLLQRPAIVTIIFVLQETGTDHPTATSGGPLSTQRIDRDSREWYERCVVNWGRG